MRYFWLVVLFIAIRVYLARNDILLQDIVKYLEIPLKVYDLAPAEVESLDPTSTQEYIERWAPTAQEHYRKYGALASISLAQGIIESRSGTSTLAGFNNHFGLKCFLKHCPRGHCKNFEDDHHKDFFRVFNSPEDSWKAHAILITTGRYSHLKRLKNDYVSWADGLKEVGYATDPKYAVKLVNLIDKWKLYEYDWNINRSADPIRRPHLLSVQAIPADR